LNIDRTGLVRHLLGTATQLFLDDKDPIAVHCLAASALEHSEYLAAAENAEPLKTHMLQSFPEMSEKDIKRIRNRHYRAIKHSHDWQGNPFDIQQSLEDFDDAQNDAILFAGWHDFMKTGAPIPVAAQVLELWFFRVYPYALNPKKDFELPLFDEIHLADRPTQKRLLRREIADAWNTYDVVADKRTDTRDLVLKRT